MRLRFDPLPNYVGKYGIPHSLERLIREKYVGNTLDDLRLEDIQTLANVSTGEPFHECSYKLVTDYHTSIFRFYSGVIQSRKIYGYDRECPLLIAYKNKAYILEEMNLEESQISTTYQEYKQPENTYYHDFNDMVNPGEWSTKKKNAFSYMWRLGQ